MAVNIRGWLKCHFFTTNLSLSAVDFSTDPKKQRLLLQQNKPPSLGQRKFLKKYALYKFWEQNTFGSVHEKKKLIF